MRDRKWLYAAALSLTAVLAVGCSKSNQTIETKVQAESEEPDGVLSGPAGETAEEETKEEDGTGSFDYAYPGMNNRPAQGETGPASENGDSENEAFGPGAEEGDFVRHKIVTATDLHYLAESLGGNRGPSFMTMTESGDGRVLQYGWEVLDAFLDDVLEEEPELVILSGDLTLNGEKKSHEELADKLSVLTEHGIEVAVIPGNHDINNPNAACYTSDGQRQEETITAEEFAAIYADYGYIAADSRDTDSLSYLYKLDDYYWILMLDSCQYDPVNQVGGMIQMGTYRWLEEILEESWEAGAQVISVSHHNLLDQSGVSREFYDDCTIEHNEELLDLLSSYEVRLHFSGHLHVQHYMEAGGIYEIVNGSLVMAPCQYGVLEIWNDGTYQYDAKETDVSGWAERNHYKNKDLRDFKSFSEQFLGTVSFRAAVRDLKVQFYSRRLFISDEDMTEMANFYAALCVHYFGGRMYEIADWVREQDAYRMWKNIDYASDLSSFLENILEDEAKDFAHLTIPY